MPLRKQFPYAVALIVATATALAMLGCAKDPRLKLAQAEHTLAVIELRLVEEANAGKLTRDEILLIDPLIQSSRAILDDADARIAAGDKDAFHADMKAVAAILNRLINVYLVPAPATQPAR
jgi:hypothetical protein